MLTDFDVIGIDEGQFFPDIVEFSESAANSGKIVVIAALDGYCSSMLPFSYLTLVQHLPAQAFRCCAQSDSYGREGHEAQRCMHDLLQGRCVY